MAKKKNSGPKTGIVVVAMLFAATGLGVLTAYVKTTPQAAQISQSQKHVDPSEVVHKSKGDKSAQVEPTGDELMVAVPKETSVTMQKSEIHISTDSDKYAALGNEILRAFDKEDMRVLRVDINKGVAVLHLNSRLGGFGSTEESQFVKALQMTYGQFPNIDRIELWSDGQKIDSLGHFEIGDGIMVTRASSESETKLP